MTSPMQIPEGEEAVELVRGLARLHGVPCDDDEFPQMVDAFRSLMAIVEALDAIDLEEETEPAGVYAAIGHPPR